MSTKSDRTYRPVEPSDLPKIQAGTLKAFYQDQNRVFPVKLVSTRMIQSGHGGSLVNMWIMDYGDNDSWSKGDNYIVVDVTPEKKYAIWNHKLQRFLQAYDDHPTKIFNSKSEGEVYIHEMVKKYAMTQEKKQNYYVVEWEIKQNDV